MAKVMLVEDDNNLREIYEARMQAEGYDVVSAKDGEEALVVAKAEKPELVISDVMMPKISGFEMLDILRNTDGLKDVKVIMLTALGQTDDQQRADRLGADRYLVKSQVTLEDIVNVAHQLLGDLPAEVAPAETPVAAVPEPAPIASEPVQAPVTVMPAPVAEPVAVAPEPAPESAPEPVPTTSASPFSAVQIEPPTTPITAPEPVAPVATEAAPAPISTIPPVSDPAAPVVIQSTAQEEASVEAQIEDFVNGASSDAPGPELVAPVAVDPIAAANAAADDQIMAEAVNNLVASAATEATPVSPIAPPLAPVAGEPATPPPAVPELSVSDPTASTPVIAGKKIISPTSESETKPDINDLLAKEEAKTILTPPAAAIVMPPAGVAPVESAAPAAAVPPAPSAEGKIDPNSIAL
jgi:CheY-like chemotaxis protein